MRGREDVMKVIMEAEKIKIQKGRRMEKQRWRQRNKRKEEAWGRSITRVRRKERKGGDRKKGKAEVDRRASGRKGGRRDGKAKV